MGCTCQSTNKTPEYKDIYDFFNQMYRANNFSFYIHNYDSLKAQITKQSSNNFKKLEKKQEVRLGFIHQVTKLFASHKDKDKEEQNIRKLLFFIIVLNITLNKFLEESEGTLSLQQQNDIEQSLMSICVNSLNKQYLPIYNLGLITFYFTKLMTSLIQPMKEIENYLSIDKYISFLKTIQDSNAIKDEDKVQFNVAIGIFLDKLITKCRVSIQKQTVVYAINFLILALSNLGEFLKTNYDNLKEIDETVIENINYLAFKSLCLNHFSVLQSETRDVSLGKNYLNEMEAAIRKLFLKPEENNKIMELLLIEMFKHCSSLINKILVTALFEFISEKITKDFTLKFYYDILCSNCLLIVTDEILNERCMRLFAMIFIEEIKIETNSSENSIKYRENMFIDKLCESIFNNLGSQKVFFSFLLSVSNEYKEIENAPVETDQEAKFYLTILYNVQSKLTSIIEKYFQTWEAKAKQDYSVKELFVLLKKFFSQGCSIKTIYAKFYESLMNFTMRFFNITFKQFHERKPVLNALISFIYDYEILAFNEENAIDEIMSLMATLQSFLIHYSKGSFQDAYLIFKLLSLVFRQYNKEVNLTITHSSIFLVYQIGIDILSIMKNVFQLPISLTIIHSEVFNGVSAINSTLANKLNNIMTSYPLESETFYSKTKATIVSNCKNGSRVISYELFSQVIDLIYSKVFGFSSSLNSFFDGEMKSRQLIHCVKEINEDNCLWEGMGVLKRKETEIITEGNITVLFDSADDLNDFSDHLNDDKIIDTNRESFYLVEAPEGINKPNALKTRKVVNGFQMREIDDYFCDNNSANKLKIKL